LLTRVDDLDELHVSRAMDCSRTAVRNHLGAADSRMRSRLGDRHDAGVASLRRYADELEPGPIIAGFRERAGAARRRRRAILVGVWALAALAAAWLVLTLIT
jgi:hypothetical protein